MSAIPEGQSGCGFPRGVSANPKTTQVGETIKSGSDGTSGLPSDGDSDRLSSSWEAGRQVGPAAKAGSPPPTNTGLTGYVEPSGSRVPSTRKTTANRSRPIAPQSGLNRGTGTDY